MKVAILSSGLPTKKYPLNGIFAFDQAKALANAGVDVTFLSVDMRSFRKIRKWGFTSGEQDNIKWYNVSVPVGPIWFIHKIIKKNVVSSLYRKAFKGDSKPDLLHAHFAGAYAYILGKEFKIPYIITEHSSAVNRDDLSAEVISSLTVQYTNAQKVLAVSNALAQRIERNIGIVPIVVPNIIDICVFHDIEKSAHNGFRIATTSNLIPLKRTINIIKVLPDIIKEIGDVHLDVIGDGPMKSTLVENVRSLGIDNYVSFYGQLKRKEIADIYAKVDCFILISTTETFGVAYVEAMAAGIPVIATRCGGPEEFVDESNGILIDVDNSEQLKNAIIYMYNHYKEYNEKSIKEYVTAQYSPGVVAKRIISVYEEVLNKK